MRTCEGRGLLVARALITGSTVLGLAVGAHVVGGGEPPSGPAVGVLAVFVLVASSLLARHRLRLLTLVPALAVIETALHGVLSVLPTAAELAGGQQPGHQHGATLSAPLPVVAEHVHAGTSPAMLGSHLVATVVTAVLLIGADRAARTTAHLLSTALPLLLARPAAPTMTRVRLRTHAAAPLVRASAGGCRSHRRRGPPLLPATA
ncbi:hypothetical protein [Cellulomonas sp. KRMCY2]|uniref:hypothetical protein n=1 Tax=Cellulomonas sp. KRMCY2 TaxID=1304865 RepID=UPI00045E687C|nr:hypothetical protein [Cellulomonas sp. KRMCY2]